MTLHILVFFKNHDQFDLWNACPNKKYNHNLTLNLTIKSVSYYEMNRIMNS